MRNSNFLESCTKLCQIAIPQSNGSKGHFSLFANRQFEPVCKICYVLEMNAIIAETGTKRQDINGLIAGGGSGLKVINKAMRNWRRKF